VVLPLGGAMAITQEDLQRDVGALGREPVEVVLLRRFPQVHVSRVVQEDGYLCGVVDGGDGPAVVVRAPWPGRFEEQVQTAALVSLAKALDGAVPAQTTWLCAARPGARIPVDGAGGTPPATPPVAAREVVAEGLADQPSAASFEEVDWRVVESAVRAQFTRDIDTDGAITARAAARADEEKLRRSRGPGTSARPSPPSRPGK
jgi:hypothetical protein